MEDTLIFPNTPIFTREQINEASATGDYRPILFEWYKYIGQTSNIIASISVDSEGFREIPKVHHAVLIGLLNRCSRLILANVALSHKGLYGETFQIIERSIFESSTKVIWLCYKNDKKCFTQYLSDGLKSDIELLNCINENITNRNGDTQTIEHRMMSSINDVIIKSGLSINEIKECKKLPTLRDMLNEIENGKSHLEYVVNQKMGSHSIHGTWTNLIKYYLEYDNGGFSLRDHNVRVQAIQFISSSFYVLNAIIAYINYVFIDDDIRENISEIFIDIQKEIQDIFTKTRKDDFEVIAKKDI